MRRRFISACAAAVAVVASATGAHAGQAPGAGAVSDGFVEVAARLLQSERAALGPSFAGAWLDGDTLNVGFAGRDALVAARRNPRLSLLASGARFVERRFSTAALNRAMDGVVATMKARGGDFTASVNVPDNAVDVTVGEAVPGLASAIVRVTVGQVPEATSRACDLRTACAIPRAGIRITNGTSACTQGFTVADANGREFALTAGHCGNNTTWSHNNAVLGTTAWHANGGNVDAQVFRLARPSLPKVSNQVFRPLDTGSRVRDKIRNPDTTIIGTRLCSEGQNSGERCGTLTSFNHAVTVDGVAYNNLGNTDISTCSGDSGAPIISEADAVAYGVLQGGVGSPCGAPTWFSWVSNVETASNYTIMTADTSTTLRTDEKLTSPDGRYEAVMQGDGNFVVYGPTGATWATGTVGQAGAYVRIQDDGNLVVYNASGGAPWASDTSDPGRRVPERLTLDNNGFLGMYVAAGYTIWGNGRDTLYAGQQLKSTKELKSKNNLYTAAMQWDGNFVVYGPNGTVPWASHTVGQANYGAWAQMQNDGNFVIYRPGPAPICASHTSGTDFRLVMRDDGNLVVSNPAGNWYPWQTVNQPRCT